MSLRFNAGVRAAACIATLVAGASFATAAQAQVTVRGGVDVTINQPGVYGRVVLGGGLPPPPVMLPEPVLVRSVPVAVAAPPQPVYLYVPPGHQKKWSKHCHRYRACNQPVYFVQEQWVRDRYAQAHPQGHAHAHGGKPAPVYAQRYDHHDDHPGHGHGRGRGHGKGKDKH